MVLLKSAAKVRKKNRSHQKNGQLFLPDFFAVTGYQRRLTRYSFNNQTDVKKKKVCPFRKFAPYFFKTGGNGRFLMCFWIGKRKREESHESSLFYIKPQLGGICFVLQTTRAPLVCFPIYNSRNQFCPLDCSQSHNEAEIYNSRNYFCPLGTLINGLLSVHLQQQKLDLSFRQITILPTNNYIYNSRNQFCPLDSSEIKKEIPLSTIVEISFVLQTHNVFVLDCQIYNSRNYFCPLDKNK